MDTILNSKIRLQSFLPSIVRWFLGEEGEQYSLPGLSGYDNYSRSERSVGVERLTHLGLFGKHPVVSCFATDSEPFYFLEDKVEADGLQLPALHFGFKPGVIFNRENDTVFFTKIGCDKISLEVSTKVKRPHVFFTFDLTSVVKRDKEVRELLNIILNDETEEGEIYKSLSSDGEFTISKKDALNKLAFIISNPSEYTKDSFISKADLKLPTWVYKSEPTVRILQSYFNITTFDTGREGHSQKGQHLSV